MASAVSKNNELLTLWLRASRGLPADEARALVEQYAEACEDMEQAFADAENNANLAIEEAEDAGYARALSDVSCRLERILNDHDADPGEAMMQAWALVDDLRCEARR